MHEERKRKNVRVLITNNRIRARWHASTNRILVKCPRAKSQSCLHLQCPGNVWWYTPLWISCRHKHHDHYQSTDIVSDTCPSINLVLYWWCRGRTSFDAFSLQKILHFNRAQPLDPVKLWTQVQSIAIFGSCFGFAYARATACICICRYADHQCYYFICAFDWDPPLQYSVYTRAHTHMCTCAYLRLEAWLIYIKRLHMWQFQNNTPLSRVSSDTTGLDLLSCMIVASAFHGSESNLRMHVWVFRPAGLQDFQASHLPRHLTFCLNIRVIKVCSFRPRFTLTCSM